MLLRQLVKFASVGLALGIIGCGQPETGVEAEAKSSQAQQATLVQLDGPTMGSQYHLSLVPGPAGLPADAKQQVEALLAELDSQFSTWRDDSEIARFNQLGANGRLPVSAAVAEVARTARQIGEASGGALDISVMPLLRLWGFTAGSKPLATLPDAASIDAALAVVGQERWSVQGQQLSKTEAGVELEFSALVAGYAADRLAERVERWGVDSYLLDVTGEMRVKGQHPQGRPWRVAVEKPEPGLERTVERIIDLHDTGMATSGDYRNFQLVNGKRYSHTLDPRSGRPVDHPLVSATVLAPSAMVADAWATALLAMGPDQAMAMAELNNLAVLLILRDGEAFNEWASSAFNAYVEQGTAAKTAAEEGAKAH